MFSLADLSLRTDKHQRQSGKNMSILLISHLSTAAVGARDRILTMNI